MDKKFTKINDDWTKEDFKYYTNDVVKSGCYLTGKDGGLEVSLLIWQIPVIFDLLEISRDNPLFGHWNCKHIKDLKSKIERNREQLEVIQENRKNYLFKDLFKDRASREKKVKEYLQFLESRTETTFYNSVKELLIRENHSDHKDYKEKHIQIGRPESFPKEKTLKWYNTLKENEEFQHKNKKPFKRKIRDRIIELHTYKDKETNQTNKPSIDTINTHFRKLDLT